MYSYTPTPTGRFLSGCSDNKERGNLVPLINTSRKKYDCWRVESTTFSYNANVIIHHGHEDGNLPNVASPGSHLDVTPVVWSRQPSAIVREYSSPTGKPIFRCRLHIVTAVRILSDSMMINPKSIVQLMVFLYQMNEENVIIFRSYLRIPFPSRVA